MEEFAEALGFNLSLVGQIREQIRLLETENFKLQSKVKEQAEEIRRLKSQIAKK